MSGELVRVNWGFEPWVAGDPAKGVLKVRAAPIDASGSPFEVAINHPGYGLVFPSYAASESEPENRRRTYMTEPAVDSCSDHTGAATIRPLGASEPGVQTGIIGNYSFTYFGCTASIPWPDPIPDYRYVAGSLSGSSRRTMNSPDGAWWHLGADDIQTGGLWRGLAHAPDLDRFVMVGQNRAMYSDDRGDHWSSGVVVDPALGSGTSTILAKLNYAEGLFVAVGQSGRIYTSPDGVTWTQQVSGTTELLHGVEHHDGLWVVVGASSKILTSPDAINWTPRTSPVSGVLYRDVRWGGDKFVALSNHASDPDKRVIYSPDGITWTQVTGVPTIEGQALAYGDGLFVAIGATSTGSPIGTHVMTSPDGITWTNRTNPGTGAYWTDITWGNGRFVTVANTFTAERVMYSDDGITWTAVAVETLEWYCVRGVTLVAPSPPVIRLRIPYWELEGPNWPYITRNLYEIEAAIARATGKMTFRALRAYSVPSLRLSLMELENVTRRLGIRLRIPEALPEGGKELTEAILTCFREIENTLNGATV